MQRLMSALILLATIAFVLSPIVSPGFSGFTADQFPVPQNDPPIQPIGLTFAVIWTIIYAWLVVMAVFGLLRRPNDPGWAATRGWLLASLVIGAAWIPVANLSPLWATLMIWVMLITALIALARCPDRDRFWLQAPLGLYAGWLTAAAPVGTAVVTTGYGATPVQPVHAAWLLFGALIAWATSRPRQPPRPFYLIALAWALLGILIANLQSGRPVFAGLATVILLAFLPRLWQAARQFHR